MDFLLGCNYWASHTGAEMWRDWNEDEVRADLEALSQNGVTCLRVFPNWRDFQPVTPLYTQRGALCEYRMEDGAPPENKSYLDPVMLARFHRLCAIAADCGIQLIVGLLTGWMSGRLFIPVALHGRNLYTDPTALLFEQLFLRGFIAEMKGEPAIYAWDLGNECNCMSDAESREAAYSWSLTVSSVIRAVDPSRIVISGMHSLTPEGVWCIGDQADACDMLTTHPYPYWVPHAGKDRIASFRTLLHATAETRYYASVGDKPCLVEEIGTMGPAVCDDEVAAGFMHVNLFSYWAHGSPGLLWWCAHDQDMLATAPYRWNMCERELGMMASGRAQKPVLLAMKQFSEFLKTAPKLPQAAVDGVCILTKDQDHWGAAYMSFLLAKQAGVNIDFAWCQEALPISPVYLMPSVKGHLVMDSVRYEALKKRVADGATLYISMDDGFLTEFEVLTGVRIADTESISERGEIEFEGIIPFVRRKKYHLQNAGAEVLAQEGKMPVFTVHRYGRGRVYYLNFPLETMLLDESNAFDGNHHHIYKEVFAQQIAKRPVNVDNPHVGVTIHAGDTGTYAVLVNYSDKTQATGSGAVLRTLYGDAANLPPFDAAIVVLSDYPHPSGPVPEMD